MIESRLPTNGELKKVPIIVLDFTFESRPSTVTTFHF